MPIHWTDFPERVDRFGDLFHIFETFERDMVTRAVHSGSCAKESDASAYTVEFVDGAAIYPLPDRVLGWELLATYTEREFYRPPSLEVLRRVRGRASEVLDVSVSAIDAMPTAEVVAALDGERRRPVGADYLLENFRWLKVTEIAKLLALNAGQVSKNADAGTFVTNGKTGHDRRIDVLSAVRWELERQARQAGGASSA